MSSAVYTQPLIATEAAAYLRISLRTLHELTRTRTIPHYRRAGSRRCYFRTEWLDDWLAGADLEVEEYGDGGRVVRPVPRRGVA